MLINPQGQKDSYDKVYILFEYSNGDFKRFCSDRGFFLQETDQMFHLNTSSLDALAKMKLIINEVVIGQE